LCKRFRSWGLLIVLFIYFFACAYGIIANKTIASSQVIKVFT
jgi:hypothetical protein